MLLMGVYLDAVIMYYNTDLDTFCDTDLRFALALFPQICSPSLLVSMSA